MENNFFRIINSVGVIIYAHLHEGKFEGERVYHLQLVNFDNLIRKIETRQDKGFLEIAVNDEEDKLEAVFSGISRNFENLSRHTEIVSTTYQLGNLPIHIRSDFYIMEWTNPKFFKFLPDAFFGFDKAMLMITPHQKCVLEQAEMYLHNYLNGNKPAMHEMDAKR